MDGVEVNYSMEPLLGYKPHIPNYIIGLDMEVKPLVGRLTFILIPH